MNRQAARSGRDCEHRGARHQRAAEREEGQPERLQDARAKPKDLRHDDAERRAVRYAEHGRLGERVPSQGLEADACHRQRASGQQRGEDPGQAQAQDDDVGKARPGVTPGQDRDHSARRDGSAAHEECGERQRQRDERKHPQHRGQSRCRRHGRLFAG